MEYVDATRIKNAFGTYLMQAQSEPVVVRKNGKEVAVLMSPKEYRMLRNLDDNYWALKAKETRKKQRPLSKIESKSLLRDAAIGKTAKRTAKKK